MYLPCRARGQAWALYGFGTAYTFTQDARFLKTAEACADYYIERTPAHVDMQTELHDGDEVACVPRVCGVEWLDRPMLGL